MTPTAGHAGHATAIRSTHDVELMPKAVLTPSTLPEESQVVLLEARGRTS